MEFFCDSKYIILPASFNAQKKRLLFYINDVLVYDLVVSLDNDQPDFHFPVNMERFSGNMIRVEWDCETDISIEKSDAPQLDYSGHYRPLIHFTTKRGWMNDPNGLAWYKGKYLMYYQHNPAATTWENMHWGSAVSEDLIHWTENGDVLFPDENGTIFSGSAVVDTDNLTGLKENNEDTILFFYTCAGGTSETSKGKRFTQNLAYSTDGGRTLVKYQNGPVLEHIVHENRDPKIVYCKADKSYIMALYLDGHEFALFRSTDLLHWNEIQRITLPDDAECPDFYPLAADGDEDRIRWVFSAASDRYCIGSFDGTEFTQESGQLQLNYGNGSYAAQSWFNTADGRRIRTAFVNIVIPDMPFGCCMDIPQEMSLKTINGRLRLCAKPIDEIRSLYLSTAHFDNISIDNGHPFRSEVNSKACDVSVTVRCKTGFSISLFGLDIEYDASEKKLKCLGKEAPVNGENGAVTLRILYDTIYTEIFAEDGSVFMGMTHIQDIGLSSLTISSDDACIEALSLSELGSFY